MKLARVLTSCLAVTWLAATACGCGIELVRPSTMPAALEARRVEEPIDAGVSCRVEGPAEPPPERAGGKPDPQVAVDTAAALLGALRRSGVFKGEVTVGKSAEGELGCEALLRVEHVSRPSMVSGIRNVYIWGVVLIVGIPLAFISDDLEPDLALRYVLELSTPGEEPLRYEVVAHGTIRAQLFGPEVWFFPEARVTLRDLALEALVSRLAADEAGLARLRAQLDDGPAPELEPLLVAKETHVGRARWRTRRLIGWKNESMAAFVAEAKSAELRRLVGRLEACMLDLSHEAEVQKDTAQAATARGSDAASARELSLAYRERVEALRPVLAAVKDELEGRGR